MRVRDLPAEVGRGVTVRGWVVTKRSSGKVRFLVVRDGSGILQCVLAQGARTDAGAFAAFDVLTQESSLEVTGTVREDRRAPGGVELDVATLAPVQVAGEFPIGPKEHGTTFLMDHRHLWLRSSRQWHILRVRAEIERLIRAFFEAHGFLLVDTPILTGAIGESAGTLFETQYFDLGTAYLAQTGQLYVEAAAMAFGNVYCFGPTFRAEKSKTRRHLTEFWMVEPEMAWCDWRGNMEVQEQLLTHVVQGVLRSRRDDLVALGRELGPLASVRAPFPRMSYDEAIERLRADGSPIEWGSDLGAEDETRLASAHDRPLFVYKYPRAAKAFYMKADPERAEVVLCNDLLAPEGYGEIVGGSQRIDDLDELAGRIDEEGLPREPYEWYLDLRRYGSVPHSGFGLGLERTVAWICGLPHVRETIPFARLINRIRP
ncbi:MAG: asparagine--tRNA ligase [Gemmatimonadetes bacterium]|nr:asparagine--tRNA ligase [Gemmatimonadota bacterium]